jgi:hypothetical protein
VQAVAAVAAAAVEEEVEGGDAAGLVFTSVFDNSCYLRAAILLLPLPLPLHLPLPLLAPPLRIVGIEGAGGGGA